MYRIAKTLNHNSFIGVEEENNREYLVMGKGIAFGKKTGQRVQPGDDARIYSLTEMTERGNARTIVQGVSPLSLELASAVLDEAEIRIRRAKFCVGVDCWGSIVYIDAKIIFKKSIFLFTLIGYLLV